MTAREDASALVQRMQEYFNTRQFDQADDLFTPDFFSIRSARPGSGRARTPGASSPPGSPASASSPRTSSLTATRSRSARPSGEPEPRTVPPSQCCSRSSASTTADSRRCGGHRRTARRLTQAFPDRVRFPASSRSAGRAAGGPEMGDRGAAASAPGTPRLSAGRATHPKLGPDSHASRSRPSLAARRGPRLDRAPGGAAACFHWSGGTGCATGQATPLPN
jgi:hypothetical protein